MKLQPVIAALSLAITSAALAHPNHGTTEGHSLLHYVAEPMHATVGVAAVAAVVAVGFVLKRSASKKAVPQKQEHRSE